MDMPVLRRPLLALVGFLTLTYSGLIAAEPPSRAARLGYISGTVSFSPAGQPDWVRAVVNRPLTTGDRLWADVDSRAELQVGGAAIRLGPLTSVTLLNLDDRIAQVQLSRGALKVRVRRMAPDQTFEVDTPNLAFTLRRPGDYRIDVDSNDDATAVMVQSGEAEVYGEGASYAVNPRQGYRFYGTGLSDYDALAARRDDDLDRWARDRDLRSGNSPSARYVSPEVVGYEDLDSNGTWRADPNYGNVWTPTRVAAGWTPYHDGHWAWVDPWGWTWVDDAPWGFAVSHYGRWANIHGSWGWVPGPPREQAVYAPALVAFVGGTNFRASGSVGGTAGAAVGWFPLAPREVYQPSYPVSRGYFDHINRSNAVIAPTTITNIYNTTNVKNVTNTTNLVKVVYANQQVTGAVVAVPTQAFQQSQSVARAAMPLSREAAISAPVAHVATVAPVQQSVHGGAAEALAKPPAREQAVVARTAPPPPAVPFAVQQRELAAKPGMPIDEAQRTQLKPAAPAATAPKVSVVTTARAPTPTALPPATPPAGKSPDARKAEAARADAAKPDAARAEAAKTDAAKAVDAKAEATSGDATKVEAAKAATAKAEASKADAAKAEAAKVEAARADAVKAEAAKAAAAKVDASKNEAAKADATKAEAAKVETARADAVKAEAAKAAAAKVDAAKAEAVKGEAARADAVKAEAAKGAAAKAEAAKVEAARADAAKTEAARTETARVEAARVDAAKAEAGKAATAKAEAAKADAARAEAVKTESAKAAAAKAEAARADAARAEAAKAEAVKADAAKAAAAKAEAARAEAARGEAARAEAVGAEAAKAATARAEAAKADAARGEAARAASPKATAAASPPTARATAAKPEAEAKAEEEKKKKKIDEEARKP
jgi:hypothetical protein